MGYGHIFSLVEFCGSGQQLLVVPAQAGIQRLSAKSVSVEWRPELGKGSHGVLIYGHRRTVVRNPKDELKKGALHGMLRQIGLRLEELK